MFVDPASETVGPNTTVAQQMTGSSGDCSSVSHNSVSSFEETVCRFVLVEHIRFFSFLENELNDTNKRSEAAVVSARGPWFLGLMRKSKSARMTTTQ